ISKGLMGIGHAKNFKGVDDPVQQTIIARKIIENDLNVRSTEDLIRRMKASSDRTTPGTPIAVAAQNAVIRDIQNKISTRLNASVEIKHTPKRGKIVITYLGNDDLQRILDTIGVKI
ncbi:MAG: chromosome partitioning protein ParB, partial [Opitutales bacterium]|nr:chromosome partitioning protein ParB [Opitutales bacterium]